MSISPLNLRDMRSQTFQDRLALRIVFVPWTFSEAEDVIGQAKRSFPEIVHEGPKNRLNRYTHLHYAPGTSYNEIKSLSDFDELYLVGHGHPASFKRDAFYTTQEGDKGKLDYDKACDRLMESGLQAEWRGDLKIYACFSADAGVDRF